MGTALITSRMYQGSSVPSKMWTSQCGAATSKSSSKAVYPPDLRGTLGTAIRGRPGPRDRHAL